jgi:hypothetical protein
MDFVRVLDMFEERQIHAGLHSLHNLQIHAGLDSLHHSVFTPQVPKK